MVSNALARVVRVKFTRPHSYVDMAACVQLGHAKVLSGVRSWQRNAVAGAALQCFCSCMVTFSDAVMAQFAGVALSLAAAGCPWLQAETQHVLQVPYTSHLWFQTHCELTMESIA